MKLAEVQKLAEKFLTIADELNEKVTNYINGSNNSEDIAAYYTVKKASNEFTFAINSYYGCNEYSTEGFNYEVAESILPYLW